MKSDDRLFSYDVTTMFRNTHKRKWHRRDVAYHWLSTKCLDFVTHGLGMGLSVKISVGLSKYESISKTSPPSTSSTALNEGGVEHCASKPMSP